MATIPSSIQPELRRARLPNKQPAPAGRKATDGPAAGADGGGGFAFASPVWLDETGSTNDDLKKLLEGGRPPPPGYVLAARRQTRGRGRLGNGWLTIPNRDLTFSFYWGEEVAPDQAGALPMACALGVGDFLASPGLEIATRCRWPNDVMTEKGKIGGILADSAAAGNGVRLVVGIGLNAGSHAELDGHAGGKAAAIDDFTSFPVGQEEMLERLLPFLAARIAVWSRGGFAAIRADLEARLWDPGTPVRVRSPAGLLAGRIAGLGDDGALLLATDAGIVATASSAALDWGGGRPA